MNEFKIVNKNITSVIDHREHELLEIIHAHEFTSINGESFINLTDKVLNVTCLDKTFRSIGCRQVRKLDKPNLIEYMNYIEKLVRNNSNILIRSLMYTFKIDKAKERVKQLENSLNKTELEKEELKRLKMELDIDYNDTNKTINRRSDKIDFVIFIKYDLTDLNSKIGYLDREFYVYIAIDSDEPLSTINLVNYLIEHPLSSEDDDETASHKTIIVNNDRPGDIYWVFNSITKEADRIKSIKDLSKENGYYYYSKLEGEKEYTLKSKILATDEDYHKTVFTTKEHAENFNLEIKEIIENNKIANTKLKTAVKKEKTEEKKADNEYINTEREKELLKLKADNAKLQEKIIKQKIQGDSILYDKKHAAASTKLDLDIFKVGLTGIGILGGGLSLFKLGIFNKETIDTALTASSFVFKKLVDFKKAIFNKDTIEVVISAVSKIASSVTKIASKFKSTIVSFADKVIDKVSSVVSSVTSSIGSFFGSVFA